MIEEVEELTLTDNNCPVYTREADGTIQKWYVCGWHGPRFSVSPVKNAKFRDYKKYFHMDDVGKTVFLKRQEAAKKEVRP